MKYPKSCVPHPSTVLSWMGGRPRIAGRPPGRLAYVNGHRRRSQSSDQKSTLPAASAVTVTLPLTRSCEHFDIRGGLEQNICSRARQWHRCSGHRDSDWIRQESSKIVSQGRPFLFNILEN
jgi:hypothetical protein